MQNDMFISSCNVNPLALIMMVNNALSSLQPEQRQALPRPRPILNARARQRPALADEPLLRRPALEPKPLPVPPSRPLDDTPVQARRPLVDRPLPVQGRQPLLDDKPLTAQARRPVLGRTPPLPASSRARKLDGNPLNFNVPTVDVPQEGPVLGFKVFDAVPES